MRTLDSEIEHYIDDHVLLPNKTGGVLKKKKKKKISTSWPFLILLRWFPTIHRLQRISPPPLTPCWVADITICDYLIILWCSILAMQCLCCKWKSCQSLLEMKVLRFSTHLLSLPQSKPSFHGAVANEGAIRLSPRRHYRVFIWICLKLQPLVIWTLFHVHHQKDIKQNAAFKIRSQSLGQIAVCVCACVHLCACTECMQPMHVNARYVFFHLNNLKLFLKAGMSMMFTESAFWPAPPRSFLKIYNNNIIMKMKRCSYRQCFYSWIEIFSLASAGTMHNYISTATMQKEYYISSGPL